MDLSLPAFLAIAVVGVGGVLGLIRVLSAPSPRLTDPERVREIMRSEHPEARVGAVALDREGRAALLALEGAEEVGVVQLVGDRPVVRVLPPAAFRRVRVDARGDLRAELGDFTFPRLALRFADGEEAAAWAGRLGGSTPAASRRGGSERAAS